MASKNNKEVFTGIRFTHAEFELIKKRADSANMKLSTYIRYILGEHKDADPELKLQIRKLSREVNYIGHNINQIVKNNNSGLYSSLDKEKLFEYMKAVNSKMRELMQKYGY